MATPVAGSPVRYGSRVEAEGPATGAAAGGGQSVATSNDEAFAGRARHIYFAIAWLFFGLGILGLILPIMPGTIFLIAALWAFSRSSRRFHNWLYFHRWFGPPLQRWQAYRVVPWSARVVAYGSMLASIIFTGFIAKLHWSVPLSIGVVAIGAILYISRCPSRVPESAEFLGAKPRELQLERSDD